MIANSPAAAGTAASNRAIFLLLATALFVIGMGAFVVVGILTPMAGALAISPATAGWAMTAYALVYAVASPLLVALTGAIERKTVVLAGLAIFTSGAVIAALAPAFWMVLAGRGVMAVGGGLVTPVAASIAAGLAAPADRGRALATVFGGLTLAQVLGVPAGAWLGYAVGWQAAFWAVAVRGLIVTLALSRLIPRGISVPGASLAALGQVLASPLHLGAVAFGVLFLSGIYCVYTFIGALLETRLGLERDGISTMLLIFGIGAVAGNWIGGRMTDRIGATRTLAALCAAQIVLLPAVSLSAMAFVPMALLMGVWSVCGWSFMAPQQARLSALDPARTTTLFALNASAIYLAASVGTLAGGMVLHATGSYGSLGIAGAAFIALAALSLAVVGRMAPRG